MSPEYIPHFHSGPKDRGKEQASGLAWPTQASQEWSSHPVQLFRSPGGVGQPPGARLKLPEWDGSLLSLPSPLLKGRRSWNSVQASAHGTKPSVGPALTFVWIHTLYSSCLHSEGAQKYRGEASKPADSGPDSTAPAGSQGREAQRLLSSALTSTEMWSL